MEQRSKTERGTLPAQISAAYLPRLLALRELLNATKEGAK